jgi:hypothetical protein
MRQVLDKILSAFFLFSLFVYSRGNKEPTKLVCLHPVLCNIYAFICLSISFSFSFAHSCVRLFYLRKSWVLREKLTSTILSCFFSHTRCPSRSIIIFFLSSSFRTGWGITTFIGLHYTSSGHEFFSYFFYFFSFFTHMCVYCLQWLFAFSCVANIAQCTIEVFFHQNKFEYIISMLF